MPRVDRWKIWCDVIVLAFMTLGNFHSALAGTGSHCRCWRYEHGKIRTFHSRLRGRSSLQRLDQG